MKYIIVKVEEPELGVTRAFGVTFPDRLVHADVAEKLVPLFAREGFSTASLFSAGECWSTDGYMEVEIGSVSCNIPKSTKLKWRDQDILNQLEAFQGIFHERYAASNTD